MYQVPINYDFQQMMVSALRYALNRQSCIVGLTIEYIEGLIPVLDDTYLSIMSRDIHEELELSHGMDENIDECWLRLKEKIDERLKEA